MNAAAIFERAADLCERGWTQGALARDASGNECPPGSKDAVCWCLEGAIEAAAGRADRWVAFDAFIEHGYYGYTEDAPHDWNDAEERTQAEVVASLRAAAASLRQKNEQAPNPREGT